MKYKHIIFIVAFSAISRIAFSQVSPTDKLLDALYTQSKSNPFEKVYLQFDKPYYGAGDTIWFKAYTVVGAKHRLSAISNVLNVELINYHNTIIKAIKLSLNEGTGYGDFALPDTLAEGNYRIRAYTNWMRNSANEYFFDKTISIINAITPNAITHTTYSYKTVNGIEMVDAAITYTSQQGNLLIGKEVTYAIGSNLKKSIRGKAITDEKGQILVSFPNPTPGTSGTGEINTTIVLDNQKRARQSIGIKATDSKVDVQFFPESGSLINGITSKVAFKATGSDGLGANIKGAIVDDQDNEIATFNTNHLGMGNFMIKPIAGKSYKANITYADGSTGKINLPKAQDAGYVMAIDNQSDSSNLKINISCAGYGAQAGAVTLVAQSGGEVYLQGNGRPGKNSFSAVIPKNKLPSGIVQFTLFTDSGEPINERLVFVQNPDQLNINISAEKKIYAPRQHVKINLDIKDTENTSAQGSFSVAVLDESKIAVDENTENSILANLLLTSDIKGYVEQPNYYFTNTSAQTIADLDILMLTQGYRRFEWKQLSDNNVPVIKYRPEKAIAIAGQIKKKGGKPVPNGKVTLMSNSNGFFATDTLTDTDGRFAFNGDFPDSVRFTIKAVTADGDDNVDIVLDNNVPFVSLNKNLADEQVNLYNGLEQYAAISRNKYNDDLKFHLGDHSILLKSVNVNAGVSAIRKERELMIKKATEFSSNLNGKGSADQVVTADQLEGKGCATIYDCLEGVLVGVIFDSTTGKPYLFNSPVNPQTMVKWPMLFVIDGITTLDFSEVENQNIDDISSIEVLRSGGKTAIYGSQGAGGVMIITLKHGNGFIADSKSDASYMQPKGFYKSRQFYSPGYGHPQVVTQIPDLRSTIYWKPDVKPDNKGKASFDFFNADDKGTYRIVVEGIDYNGKLGRQVYRYKVD